MNKFSAVRNGHSGTPGMSVPTRQKFSHEAIMKQFFRNITRLLAFSLFVLTPAILQGQVANGVITGRLTDTTGAVVRDAQVTLTKVDTSLTFTAQSNGDGIYTFPSLQTGPYKVQVVLSGFKKAETTLTLGVGQTANIDLSLEVGSSAETVNVESAGMADLETSDSTISYTVGARQVSDLPLNGRRRSLRAEPSGL